MSIVIKCSKIKHLFVPHYKPLSCSKIFAFLNNHPESFQYFPDAQDIDKLSRQWVINVAYTVVGDAFKDWVNKNVEERNQKQAVEKNLIMQIDPELEKAFMASSTFSQTNGSCVNMLKLGSKLFDSSPFPI